MWIQWRIKGSRCDRSINRPFPNFLVPLLQTESSSKAFHLKITLICMKMNLQAELLFIWMVSLFDFVLIQSRKATWKWPTAREIKWPSSCNVARDEFACWEGNRVGVGGLGRREGSDKLSIEFFLWGLPEGFWSAAQFHCISKLIVKKYIKYQRLETLYDYSKKKE